MLQSFSYQFSDMLCSLLHLAFAAKQKTKQPPHLPSSPGPSLPDSFLVSFGTQLRCYILWNLPVISLSQGKVSFLYAPMGLCVYSLLSHLL